MIARSPQIRKNARLAAGVFVLAALLNGCASMLVPQTEELREAPPAGLAQRVELKEVPFFPQTEYQCGPAALAIVLANFHVKITPDDLVGEVYLPERKGSLQVEMLAAARRHGLISYQLAPRFEDLLREIAVRNPVIVLENLGVWPFDSWHYAVAVGYDLGTREMLLRSGEKERLELPFAVHEYLWRKSDYWAMVAVPPDRIPATAEESRWLAAVAALERLGKVAEAREAYAAALQRWPESVNAAIGLANTHYASGDLKEAEGVLRALVMRRPDSVVALNNLAQTLSDEGKNDEALKFIEQAAAAGGPFVSTVRETRELILKRIAGKP